MKSSVRIVAEYYDPETDEILNSEILREDTLKKPSSIKDLGYLHEEQIELLQLIQDFKLRYDAELINPDGACPKCEKKTRSNGKRVSKFHAVFTDHKVKIQRRNCTCGWNGPDTIDKIYGSSSHPDLVEKQVTQGVENSYRQASKQLNSESKKTRSINNDDRIRRNVATVSTCLEKDKVKKSKSVNKKDAVKNLVAVIDGGHLKSKDKDKRSFEAMIATVYCPSNLNKIDKYHNEITQKTSVASALSDKQETIKKLILHACRKEKINSSVTVLTCLTDGANNCWSIANHLKTYSKELITILDWFHVTKRFTILNNQVDEELKAQLEKVKWFLWHGKSENGLLRLISIQESITDEKLLEKTQELYEYLKRNQKHMVNYQKRQSENLPFTSTYAESSVNTVINTRQKNDKKMQWTREGAHSVLQIRTSKFSKKWEEDWNKAQSEIYKEAA